MTQDEQQPGAIETPALIHPSELRTLISQRAEQAYREEHDENND